MLSSVRALSVTKANENSSVDQGQDWANLPSPSPRSVTSDSLPWSWDAGPAPGGCSATTVAEAISADVDRYMSTSKVGRAALACGDVKVAVEQFNEAMDIELQLELQCLYDSNLGYVNGLVRQAVEARLSQASQEAVQPPGCDPMLHKLKKVYMEAEKRSEQKPKDFKCYLRMGSTLCLVNEWEKARLIYREGLNLCKRKKELLKAVQRLNSAEDVIGVRTDKNRLSLSLNTRRGTMNEMQYFTSPPSSPPMEMKHKRVTLRNSFLRRPRSKSFTIAQLLVSHETRREWCGVFTADFLSQSVLQSSVITHLRRLSIVDFSFSPSASGLPAFRSRFNSEN